MNNKRIQSVALRNIFKVLLSAKKDLETINFLLPNVKFKDNQDCQAFIRKFDDIIEDIDQLADSDIEEVDLFEDTL